MALTFPRTDIVDPWNFATQSFTLPPRQETSTGADGTIWGKDFGPRLWLAQYGTGDLDHDSALALEAKLNSLRGVIHLFEAGDGRRPYPRAHKNGAFNDTGKLKSGGDDNMSLSLSGLDAGFKLSVGDYLSFAFGTKRALHQVLEGVTADGSGDTVEFAVCPEVRPGFAIDAAVKLKKPSGLFLLVPGSVEALSEGPRSNVIFQARQVA